MYPFKTGWSKSVQSFVRERQTNGHDGFISPSKMNYLLLSEFLETIKLLFTREKEFRRLPHCRKPI